MINLQVCPICSGNDFQSFLVCKDYTTSGEEFSLKKCSQCGFTLTNPQPDEHSIGKYYLSEKYISHTGGQKKLFDSIYLLARKIALGRKRTLIQKKSSGKSILDFGCGTGEFLSEMKNHQWNITGVEPSEHANRKASELTSTKIYDSIDHLAGRTYDVITLWHVLEHLHDLNGSLQKFSKLLSDSGTIFIAVPNLESHDADYYKEYWAGYDVPRHLWHFDKQNMKQILEHAGFKLKEIVPMKMDSFYVSLLSESYRHPNQMKLISLCKAFVQGFTSNRLAKRTKNYSSLIYISTR